MTSVRLAGAWFAISVSVATITAAPLVRQEPQCSRPILPGFVDITRIDWAGPWVFERTGATRRALSWIGERPGPRPASRQRTVPFHIDDGSVGGARIQGGPCEPPQTCELPAGLPDESLWLLVSDGSGRVVARRHFQAAYQLVEIVPVDLIGSAGDEVLIFRTPAHASPSVGYVMNIWSRRGGGFDDLSEDIWVGTWIAGENMNWRVDLLVDLTTTKPRSLSWMPSIGIEACHAQTEPERIGVDQVKSSTVVRYNPTLRKYVRD